MAATYGYGGEFSSDEDIDRIEQHSERLAQSRFNTDVNPTTQNIEETIETIRALSPDEDINLTDDVLAGLLDHFKTQRGPIVDSTRKLYKNIVLKFIRGGSKQVTSNELNGNHGTNNNNNNNDDIGIVNKHKPLLASDSFSSDEEEPVAPIIVDTPKKRNEVVNDEKNVEGDNVEMDIDSETPSGRVRETKQVDINTDDDDDDAESSSSDSEVSKSDDLNSESDVLDVTPIKPAQQQQHQAVVSKDKAKSVTKTLNVAPRRLASESSVKNKPLAHSTPKELASTVKKPYTRSQRRAVGASEKASDSFIETKTNPISSNDGNRFSLRRRAFILVSVATFVALLAYLVYQYRASRLSSSTIIPKISFS